MLIRPFVAFSVTKDSFCGVSELVAKEKGVAEAPKKNEIGPMPRRIVEVERTTIISIIVTRPYAEGLFGIVFEKTGTAILILHTSNLLVNPSNYDQNIQKVVCPLVAM